MAAACSEELLPDRRCLLEQALRREIVYARLVLHALLAERVRMHTIDDIIALPEGERAELLDGEMFMITTPTWLHQKTIG